MRGKIPFCLGLAAWLSAGALSADRALAVNDLSLVVSGSTSVAPGASVTVTLQIANLSAPINGVQALIGYDPAVLSLSSITPTDLGLTPPATGWTEISETDSAGNVVYAVAAFGGSTGANHTVATLLFNVIGEGTTPIIFRPDAPPYATKLTVAATNATILPNKINSAAIISACSDGLFCNGLETFNGLVCVNGTIPCNDGVSCTVDVCNEASDSCTNTPNNAACNDGLFCTGVETCSATLGCQPGVFPCGDGIACTDDICNEASDSCSSTPNDANCDDGVFCNGDETCHPVLGCQAGTNPCIDSVGCTVDSCNEATDTCINAPNDAFCSNGLFCDGAETCDPLLGCQPATDPCAPLLCNETTDTCFAPIHVAALELFHNGRFGNQANPNRRPLGAGGTANTSNILVYTRGITGIRVLFNDTVTFATTPEAAFSFEWTTGTATTFAAVPSVAGNFTVTAATQASATVVTIVVADHYVKRRWLKVTLDANQVTRNGVALDGEVLGNPAAMPSGNGSPGGNTVFYVGNVTGDVDADRKTTLTDVGLVRGNVNPFVTVSITNVFDVDKDGRVLLADVGATRAEVNPFFTLPLISP